MGCQGWEWGMRDEGDGGGGGREPYRYCLGIGMLV